MFTSRSEHRLQCRVDNADLRLTAKGIAHGVIRNEERMRRARRKYGRALRLMGLLRAVRVGGRTAWDAMRSGKSVGDLRPALLAELGRQCPGSKETADFLQRCAQTGISSGPYADVEKRGLRFLLRRRKKGAKYASGGGTASGEPIGKGDTIASGDADEHAKKLRKLRRLIAGPDRAVEAFVAAQAKYSDFVRRYDSQFRRAVSGRPLALSPDTEYSHARFRFMSAEEIEILARERPATVQEAMRLPGVTPATVVQLANAIINSRGA